MDTMEWLAPNRDITLKRVLQTYGKTEQQLDEDNKIIKNWLKAQPHLPEIPSDNFINNFLLMNKFSVETTKQKLDMYYTIRQLQPEVYSNKINSGEKMRNIADICYFIPLPKRTENGERITVIKITDGSEDKFDTYELMGYAYNTYEVRLEEDINVWDVFIYDLVNIRMSHVVKITPIHLRVLVTILEKVYSNIVKNFHILNCPPYAITILNVLKQFMKPKLASRIIIHENNSKLKEHISEDILPSDFGGKEKSLYELNELWKQKLSEYNDRFVALSEMKVDEKLRPTPLQNDEVLGYHGNFKKLEMD